MNPNTFFVDDGLDAKVVIVHQRDNARGRVEEIEKEVIKTGEVAAVVIMGMGMVIHPSEVYFNDERKCVLCRSYNGYGFESIAGEFASIKLDDLLEDDKRLRQETPLVQPSETSFVSLAVTSFRKREEAPIVKGRLSGILRASKYLRHPAFIRVYPSQAIFAINYWWKLGQCMEAYQQAVKLEQARSMAPNP